VLARARLKDADDGPHGACVRRHRRPLGKLLQRLQRCRAAQAEDCDLAVPRRSCDHGKDARNGGGGGRAALEGRLRQQPHKLLDDLALA
jgi:hypothetical protein